MRGRLSLQTLNASVVFTVLILDVQVVSRRLQRLGRLEGFEHKKTANNTLCVHLLITLVLSHRNSHVWIATEGKILSSAGQFVLCGQVRCTSVRLCQWKNENRTSHGIRFHVKLTFMFAR